MAPPISQLNTETIILVTRPEPEPAKPATPEPNKTKPSESVDKLARLENSRANEIKQIWMKGLTDGLDHAQGFVEGFNAFTVIKDIGYDYLKIPRSQKYWEGRVDGGNVAMIVDLAMMSGGTGAAMGSLECAVTTLGFCVPVAGPGVAIGGAVALAGTGLYGIHGDNLEKAKEQYAESRGKEPAQSTSQKAPETHAEQGSHVTGKEGVAPEAQKPKVENSKLSNIIEELYKGSQNPKKIGDGTTADAIRNELKTGKPTNRKFHIQKGKDYARALEKWLENNPHANTHDRQTAQHELSKLFNALEGK